MWFKHMTTATNSTCSTIEVQHYYTTIEVYEVAGPSSHPQKPPFALVGVDEVGFVQYSVHHVFVAFARWSAKMSTNTSLNQDQIFERTSCISFCLSRCASEREGDSGTSVQSVPTRSESFNALSTKCSLLQKEFHHSQLRIWSLSALRTFPWSFRLNVKSVWSRCHGAGDATDFGVGVGVKSVSTRSASFNISFIKSSSLWSKASSPLRDVNPTPNMQKPRNPKVTRC